MSKPNLFLYSDLGTSGDGSARMVWVPNLADFRKATGAKWGIRAAGGDEPQCLAILPEGYKPTGNLADCSAVFQRKHRFVIQ